MRVFKTMFAALLAALMLVSLPGCKKEKEFVVPSNMTHEEAALFTAIANVCPKDDNHSKVEYLTFFIEGWSFDKLPPEITSYLTEYCANSGANLVQLSYEDLVAQGYITKGDGDFYKTYDDTYKMGLGKIFTFTLKDGESTDADTCTVAVKGFISESDTSGFDVELQYVDGAWKFVKYSNAWNQHQFFTPEPENSDGPEKG